jgi:hypothetical protein
MFRNLLRNAVRPFSYRSAAADRLAEGMALARSLALTRASLNGVVAELALHGGGNAGTGAVRVAPLCARQVGAADQVGAVTGAETDVAVLEPPADSHTRASDVDRGDQVSSC